MTEVEKYKKLKAELEGLMGRLNTIPSEIDRIRAELVPMQDAAVRAEITGDKHAANRRAEIEQAKRKTADLEAERKDLLHRTKIMRQVLDEYRVGANQELVVEHQACFKKAQRAFAEAILAAAEAEGALAKVRREAHAAFQEIDQQNGVPAWDPQFIPDLTRDGLRPNWQNFLETQLGYRASK